MNNVTEWLIAQIDTVSPASSTRTLLVHPLDENEQDQRSLADKLSSHLERFSSNGDSSRSEAVQAICSLWHGLDLQTESEGPFTDEQSLGFAMSAMIDQLQGDGVLAFCVKNSTVKHGDSCEERLSTWLQNFGVIDCSLTSTSDGAYWLIRGRKAASQRLAQELRLGLILAERKIKKVLSTKFKDRATEMGVKLVSERERADVVLFKSDDLDAPIPDEWKTAVVVDVPSRVAVLLDRMKTETRAKSALASLNESVFFPASTLDATSLKSFPVLAKPNNASAHRDLWFIDSRESLDRLPSGSGQYFFQECIDHGPILFKVSVIGKEVSLARRPSAVPSLAGPMRLLTRKGDEHPRKSKALVGPSVGQEMETAQSVPGPNYMLIQKVARSLQDAFGLHLIGFDLLMERSSNRLFLVDINYFPSFADVPDRERVLLRTLWEMSQQSSSN